MIEPPSIFSFTAAEPIILPAGGYVDRTSLSVSASDNDGQVVSYLYEVSPESFVSGIFSGSDTATGKVFNSGLYMGNVVLKVTVTDNSGAIAVSRINVLINDYIVRRIDTPGLDLNSGDQFGYSNAISGDGRVYASGAIYGDGTSAGSGFIYTWGEGRRAYKISPSDAAQNDNFGSSVDISDDGNVMVVGMPRDDDYGWDRGSIYIYRWNGSTWSGRKIRSSDGSFQDYFGSKVAVSGNGNRVVASAPGKRSTGAVYVYRWNGSDWIEEIINASNGSDYIPTYFGSGVDISYNGNRIVIGHRGYNTAYIYRYSGGRWTLMQRIYPPDPSASGFYGGDVAISNDGNTVVVGAASSDGSVVDSGAIYIWSNNGSTWNVKKITAPDAETGDYFGGSVCISGDGTTIAVGASSNDDYGYDSGALYVLKYYNGSWYPRKINAPDGAEGDRFGIGPACSYDGKKIINGAPYKGAGAIYQIYFAP
jgi:hypothetical protein